MNDSIKTAINTYQSSGGNRQKAAEKAFYSLSGIQHVIRDSKIKTNPSGRPPIRPSTRSTATIMRLKGLKIDYIARILDRVSNVSLWRMFGNMKRQETSLSAVSTVLVHPHSGQILIHQEKYPNETYHLYEGDHSVQMTWRSDKESNEAAITRMLEREVFAGLSIGKIGLDKVIKGIPRPLVNVVVADVNVSMFRFELTDLALNLELGSDKVTNIHFTDPKEVLDNPEISFRAGAREIIELYLESAPTRANFVKQYLSNLNIQFLASLAK